MWVWVVNIHSRSTRLSDRLAHLLGHQMSPYLYKRRFVPSIKLILREKGTKSKKEANMKLGLLFVSAFLLSQDRCRDDFYVADSQIMVMFL